LSSADSIAGVRGAPLQLPCRDRHLVPAASSAGSIWPRRAACRTAGCPLAALIA